jgi:hypothetical protein
MKTIQIAAIVGVILVLAEAGWWASKNWPSSAKVAPAAQQPTLATPKSVLTQVNASAAAVAPLPAALATNGSPNTAGTAVGDAETEQRLGPFSLSGTNYTVILKKRKQQSASKEPTGDTVVAMEIRDAAESVLYRRNFPYLTVESDFTETWTVSAAPLVGTNATGLLVTYDDYSEPSAPEAESSGWYQVFGVVKGKLKAFSGPILVQGDIIQPDNGAKVYKTTGPLDSHSDALNFKVWAHHFRLVYPVRIDWTEGKVSPALACSKGTGSTSQACSYKVLPENDRWGQNLTFVQLCPEASTCDHPERVLVKKDSKLELLGCAADVKWSEGRSSGPVENASMDDQGGVAVGTENLQLQIRVDGKEGWTHTEEDFNALGLPFDQ